MIELPTGWARTTVEALSAVSYGKGLRKDLRNEAGPYPVFGSAGIAGHHDEPLVDGPVVVVGRKGNAGEVHLSESPCWPIDTTYYLKPPTGVDERFLALQLASIGLGQLDSSTAIPSLRREDLGSASVALPPLPEQRRIVAAIDEQLARLGAADSLLDKACRRMDRLRESAVESALAGEWPLEPLSSRTVEQRYGSSAKACDQGEVPVIRMGNIRDGRLDYTKLKYLPRDHADVTELQLRDGDLLFNRTNSAELVGKTAVFRERSGPVTFASYLIRVRLDDALDPRWASTHINSRRGRRYIDSVVTQQVGQANVNGTKLKNFPIPVPPIEVQHARMARLDVERRAMDGLQTEVERCRTKLAALRRSILAAAFSGRLVPQDPSDEPASVLLDRIAAERAAAKASRRKKAAS